MAANVLVVDDEKGILNVLKIYLEDAGYRVSTAQDGKIAARLIDKNNFEIILTDIRMPGMDGISLLKHVKKKSPDTQVIMITGHGDYKLAIESLKLDAVDFIAKPIDNDVLDIALKRANDRIAARKEILKYTRNLEEMVAEKTRELDQSRIKYSRLFNESPSYITIQDKDLKIVETNKIFARHFNFEEGQTCHEVYKNRTSPCQDCPVIKTFKDGQSHTAEMEVVIKDGSKRHIFIQTSAIHDENGKINHVMEMSTDVTIIRELQDHLAALGLHIGSVSHGLKQLLTGLDGGSYLIEAGLKKQDTPQITEGWEMVKEKISATREMVLNILYHAKNRTPDKSVVPLKTLMEEIVSTISPKAHQEKVDFKVEYPKEDINLHIDKKAIFFAFISVIENAVDACLHKKGKGKVQLNVQTALSKIIFSIKDNGKGMDEKHKDKIFSLFYSDKGNEGTGLGLFIAQRTIKQHNGHIDVNSKKGEYTEFIITIPL